jgi:SAM-dependent methyltransferase
MLRSIRPSGPVVQRTRSFDLVVFAQSFHWVQPRVALKKVATILSPDGRCALLSNRITPLSPTRQDFDEAYAGYLNVAQRPPIDAAHDDDLTAIVEECGFSIIRRARGRVAQESVPPSVTAEWALTL